MASAKKPKRPRADRRKTVEARLPKTPDGRADAIRRGTHCGGRVRLA